MTQKLIHIHKHDDTKTHTQKHTMTQTYTMAHNDAYNNTHNDKQKLNKITHIVIHRKHEHTKKGSEY